MTYSKNLVIPRVVKTKKAAPVKKQTPAKNKSKK
tara:strand:- start:323 stop:424 length:102 start_codon:yes stop_codon:yes gene_type:complete